MNAPLTVLLTNGRLAKRTGTECYIFDLAVGLLKRGHRPIVYSPSLGPLAVELRRRTVPVVDRLERMAVEPDVIHGHHGYPTVCALLAHPRTPAVFVCHSWESADDEPPQFQRIRRYLAVDETCRDRVVCEGGIAPSRTAVLPNFVDLDRFPMRRSLPRRPSRAVLFTNRGGPLFVQTVRNVCRRRGIALDLLGSIAGRSCADPARELVQFDLVFARAKAAMEGIAVGAAVILCDRRGLGPMVTSDDFDRLRRLNFGLRALDRPCTSANLSREIDRFDSDDAQRVAQRFRREGGIDLAVEALVDTYREVIAEQSASPVDTADESRDVFHYLERLGASLQGARHRSGQRERLRRVLRRFTAVARVPWDAARRRRAA